MSMQEVPLGHSTPSHQVLGWCSHCPGHSVEEELGAWQVDAMDRMNVPQLTVEEAREQAAELATELYKAQDVIAWVKECCDVADREQRTITTEDVRKWLKGVRCGRQLLAAPPASADQAAMLSELTDDLNRRRDMAAVRGLPGINQPADGTRCTCGGRFPTLHLHADTHEPVVPDVPEKATE